MIQNLKKTNSPRNPEIEKKTSVRIIDPHHSHSLTLKLHVNTEKNKLQDSREKMGGKGGKTLWTQCLDLEIHTRKLTQWLMIGYALLPGMHFCRPGTQNLARKFALFFLIEFSKLGEKLVIGELFYRPQRLIQRRLCRGGTWNKKRNGTGYPFWGGKFSPFF